ncbi:MAG TPA: GGDEF domain-containing protein, partial [Gammaproteobacteria bacterium]|nr:GGDEF domain-containing protein [Gammaproteobacteria bacterium]
FRSSDIVGRLGGEEFAVILPKTSMRTALLLANKLRIRIDQAKVHAPKGMIHVTVSIGIAHMDRATVTLEQVIANADSALYQAKQNGRNRVERFHSEAITLFHSGSPP